MHLGIDFDNTVINYDRVFYKYALKRHLINRKVKKNKHDIRNSIRLLPEGNDRWTELQAQVYGCHIDEAKFTDGIKEFLRLCRENSVKVSIISHKTIYPAWGPRINLRQVARQWLEDQGLLNGFGLSAEDIIFVDTLDEKLSQISQRGCTHFIDDLTDVLLHPNFPMNVERILYAPKEAGNIPQEIHQFKTWREIEECLFDNKKIAIINRIEDLLLSRLNEKPVIVQPLKGGINSLVYKVITDRKSEYLVKQYRVFKGDQRNRFSSEFSGINFLWSNGIREIPEPICANPKHRIGVYRFIKGKKFKPGKVLENDIYLACEFLGALHALVNVNNANQQPIASEACFSINSYIDCIENRLQKLQALATENSTIRKLYLYLDSDFLPFFIKIKRIVEQEARSRGIDLNKEIEKSERTLSPSDFGFHNAIKRNDGSLVFIDFEYYGWDDPAKMIADFYLQPAVPVPYVFRELFFEKVLEFLGRDATLVRRLPLVYILLALKWCLIMLNVFLRSPSDCGFNEKTYIEQLKKARNKLRITKREFEARVFPLSLF